MPGKRWNVVKRAVGDENGEKVVVHTNIVGKDKAMRVAAKLNKEMGHLYNYYVGPDLIDLEKAHGNKTDDDTWNIYKSLKVGENTDRTLFKEGIKGIDAAKDVVAKLNSNLASPFVYIVCPAKGNYTKWNVIRKFNDGDASIESVIRQYGTESDALDYSNELNNFNIDGPYSFYVDVDTESEDKLTLDLADSVSIEDATVEVVWMYRITRDNSKFGKIVVEEFDNEDIANGCLAYLRSVADEHTTYSIESVQIDVEPVAETYTVYEIVRQYTGGDRRVIEFTTDKDKATSIVHLLNSVGSKTCHYFVSQEEYSNET